MRRQWCTSCTTVRRRGGPGYGRTLGEALVSEGLAGHFVARALGSPPEPWERAVDEAALLRHRPDAATLGAAPYDHAGWFFGFGGHRPRWLGYTLGHRIVGEWLAAAPEVAGPTWFAVPAPEVLAASALLRQAPA